MTETHEDRTDWCVLRAGHEGRCLADWEYKLEMYRKSLQNWRGRRYNVCTAVNTVRDVISHLGEEDNSQLPPLDGKFSPRPPEPVLAELRAMSDSLLRLILVLNDGS